MPQGPHEPLNPHLPDYYNRLLSRQQDSRFRGEDKTVKLWDARTGQELAMLKGHAARVYSVAFSSDGKTLASGSSDKTVKLWVGDARK